MQSEFRRYWIFQGMPERYDLRDELEPGKTESWVLSRYGKAIHPGDIVYFWRGGRKAALYGWGEITGEPDSRHSKADDTGIQVTYRTRFREPLSKKELTSLDEETGALAGLLILRAPQGTNFKVTTGEAIALNRLLEGRSEEIPPDPSGTGSSEFPALTLLPLSFGRSVTRVIGAGLKLASPVLNGPGMFEALVGLSHSEHSPDRGVASLLRESFDEQKSVSESMRIAMTDPVPLSPMNLAGLSIDAKALDIVEAARLLAIQSANSETIGVRHFFGAILLAGSGALLDQITNAYAVTGRPIEELARRFAKFTVAEFPNDNSSTWLSRWLPATTERFDDRRVRTEAETSAQKAAEPDAGSTPKPALDQPEDEEDLRVKAFARAFAGRPLTDRPSGHDLLRIKEEVKALAHLFALCDDVPTVEKGETDGNNDAKRATFALGLFGRWGAGKSFFIEKMKQQINSFSQAATAGNSPYCKDIIQIDFNAWHYNEADIWASLVHHIFDSLRKHFAAKEQKEKFRKLLSRLEISQQRREEIENKLTKKQGERDTIHGNIVSKQKLIESNVERQMTQIGTVAHVVASEELQRNLTELLSEAAVFMGVPKDQGFAATGKSAGELLTTLQESGALAVKTHSAGKTVLNSAMSVWFIVILGVVAVIYVSVPKLIEGFSWSEFLPQVGQGLVALTAVLTWIKVRLSKTSGLFDRIAGMEAALRNEVRREEKRKDEELVTLREDFARIEKEIEHNKEQLGELDQDIRNITAKLDELGSPESLLDFINDRAKSDDYRSKLGILALIRSDFEKLSTLMTNKNLVEDESGDELPHLDRIILYIDDLDRVQESSKVLQVLEAVHLLLAFPLFHVVVAVDERWAARSVENHHSKFFLSVKNNATPGASVSATTMDAKAATPREFLEKIFQICFWVRPLSTQLAHELINGMVQGQTPPPDTEQIAATSVITGSAPTVIVSDSATVGGLTDNAPVGESEQTVAAASPNPGHDDEGSSVVTAESHDDDENNEAGEVENNEDESAGRNEANNIDFAVSDEELISMRALSRIIGRSPRSVKRFINTYRLFKAMRIPPGSGAVLTDPLSPSEIAMQHVPIMFLLAIQIGHPDVAFHLFKAFDKELEADDSQTIGAVIEKLQGEVPADVNQDKWHAAVDSFNSVFDLWGDYPALHDVGIASLDDWLLGTSRFGFKEWVPSADRLWQ